MLSVIAPRGVEHLGEILVFVAPVKEVVKPFRYELSVGLGP
jgi:hypothetical protein